MTRKPGLKLNVLRKLCSLEQLYRLGAGCRAQGRTVVHCHGCFDIVHPGHLKYLQFAHQQGEILVVSLSSDDAIEKSDGTRPYMPQEFRAESLAALEFVDHVVVSETATAEPIIRALRPDVYIKGKDYERSSHPGFLAEKALVESLGGRVIFSSGDVIFSSSAILDDMKRGAPSRRARCCGTREIGRMLPAMGSERENSRRYDRF